LNDKTNVDLNNLLNSSGLYSRLRAELPHLNPAERAVADYILANPEKVLYCSISELSANTGTSDATVIRLCRLLGYSGYQELKITLAREKIPPIRNIHENISPDDDITTAVGKAFRANIQAISDTLSVLNMSDLEKAADILVQANSVSVYGLGTSGLAAQNAYYKLFRAGIRANVFPDSHVQAMSTAQLGPNDAAIAISHSGSTKELVRIADLCKERGATVICITNHSRSPLAKRADLVLLTASLETPFSSGGMPTMFAQLSIIDALFIAVALKTYDRATKFMELTGEAVKDSKY